MRGAARVGDHRVLVAERAGNHAVRVRAVGASRLVRAGLLLLHALPLVDVVASVAADPLGHGSYLLTPHRTAGREVATFLAVDDLCDCGAPVVCLICETCPEDCHTAGGPDACWEAHEKWRLGGPDDSLQSITASMPPVGVRPAPKPKWS